MRYADDGGFGDGGGGEEDGFDFGGEGRAAPVTPRASPTGWPGGPRHSWASAHGHGAAPETPMRTVERSAAASSALSRSRRNIVATPGNTVTRWRRIDSTTASGAKR